MNAARASATESSHDRYNFLGSECLFQLSTPPTTPLSRTIQPPFSEAAGRAVHDATRWLAQSRPAPWDVAILLGLLSEPECRAGVLLASLGIDQAAVLYRWAEVQVDDSSTQGDDVPALDLSDQLESAWPHLNQRPELVETEHLLLAVLTHGGEAAIWLRERGLCLEAVRDDCIGHTAAVPVWDPTPLAFDLDADTVGGPSGLSEPARVGGRSSQSLAESLPDEPPMADELAPRPQSLELEPSTAAPEETTLDWCRLVDAAANRSRESLRVIEDYVRFVLDDRHLVKRLKSVRHEVAQLAGLLLPAGYLAARDTLTDVGTEVHGSGEDARTDMGHVAMVNFGRLEEALRSLEEFGKLVDPSTARRCKALRYDAYTLHKAVGTTGESLGRFPAHAVYVLVDGRDREDELIELVTGLVRAGVSAIQLRDKRLDDRELMARARAIRAATRGTNVLFIVNDRADVAAVSEADGVHIGQDELSVRDVRRIVGSRALVGVSTHNLHQARQAVLEGASYLGAGPTFMSKTKSFAAYPGIDYLRQVAAEISLPTFAIGGITEANLEQVLAAGMRRVAVSGGVMHSADPVAAARRLVLAVQGGE